MHSPERCGGYAAEDDAGWFVVVVRDDSAVPKLPIARVVAGLWGHRTVQSCPCRIRIHRAWVALIGQTPFLIVFLVLPYLTQPLRGMRQQRLHIVLQKEALQECAANRVEPGVGIVEGASEIPHIGRPQAER